MSAIEIIGTSNGQKVVLSDADSKKQARQQVDYWQRLKGKGWRIFSKAN